MCGSMGACGIVDAPRFWGWRGFSARALGAVAAVLATVTVIGSLSGKLRYPIEIWRPRLLTHNDLALHLQHGLGGPLRGIEGRGFRPLTLPFIFFQVPSNRFQSISQLSIRKPR